MVTFSVLLDTLKSATKRLRVLRFAWGLVGLSAAAALVIRLHGEGRAAIIATGFALVGFVLLIVAAYVAGPGARLFLPAMLFIWSVTLFFIIFLVFTLTAFAFSVPCNWVLWLAIPSQNCGGTVEKTATGHLNHTREVDFTRLHCLPDGSKNDEVIYTDVITFLDTPPPSRYYRRFNYDAATGASLIVRDLVRNVEIVPTVKDGIANFLPRLGLGYSIDEGTQKYGLVPVRVARATGEARIQWRYRNVHSTSSEGTGLTAAAETSSDTKERYVIHTLNVTYRLPSGIQLSQRAFDGGQDLDQKCQRKPDGFTCINLDTGAWVRETWHWNVWDSCSAGH